MNTLKSKLLIGLLPTLVILVALGLWAIVMFYRLGNNIDVILRENYRSVVAAEGMKEAIERMDSGLLFEVIEPKNILFGSEMIGAVRGIDPTTGHYFDDTRRYVDALELEPETRAQVYEHNARRVYPRLEALR